MVNDLYNPQPQWRIDRHRQRLELALSGLCGQTAKVDVPAPQKKIAQHEPAVIHPNPHRVSDSLYHRHVETKPHEGAVSVCSEPFYRGSNGTRRTWARSQSWREDGQPGAMVLGEAEDEYFAVSDIYNNSTLDEYRKIASGVSEAQY